MKAKVSPTVEVNPEKCRIAPPGPVHVPGKGKHGFINFDAKANCTLLFTNPKVFGVTTTHLSSGNNKRSVKVNHGHTYVMIAGRTYKIPKSLGAASSPTDIIVP